ncbi:hypothetical protein C0992_003387 [Termitomyces sp. T32_za158]|nr:hypothetical protein C0992_003387 [Termitomyces sp. T32_za158]
MSAILTANNADSTQDCLDSILPTTLDGLDDGFCELAERRIYWWDSARLQSWLSNVSDRGYTFYQRLYRSPGDPSDTVFPAVIQQQEETTFPYAYHVGPAENAWPAMSANSGDRALVGYAQDAEGRHVALKAILFGSEEYRILKHLQDQGVPTSVDDFQNVIPVLDIIPCEGHWLAFMPRMQDIKTENILVNHVDRHYYDEYNIHRMSLRTEGKLTYALFDFSHSTMFPETVRINECRLPSKTSFRTYWVQRPDDTHQGEVDFDPFAFDVGMLGVLFCTEFQHLTYLAPMLAPLFDMMTTRTISRRFTASAALTFFEEQVQPLTFGSENIACRRQPLNVYPVRYDEFDRWQDLDPEFIKKWAKFQSADEFGDIVLLIGLAI